MRTRSTSYTAGRSDWMTYALWIAGTAILAVVALLVGVIVAAGLGASRPRVDWVELANIGDSFGVINAVVAAFALGALVVTMRLQSRELALQRHELELQRKSLDQQRLELHRSAQASLRLLHTDLLKLSIGDASLAAVWPMLDENATHETQRQHLYANMIYQHLSLSASSNDYSPEHFENRVRYLFSSAIMREYWRAASKARLGLQPGTAEFDNARIVDMVCLEYEQPAR